MILHYDEMMTGIRELNTDTHLTIKIMEEEGDTTLLQADELVRR
jgi:hypothetical protein